MRIVIDIPDEDYKDIIDGYICQELADEMLNRVKAGTPLSKGHGDLVDRNILLNEAEWFGENCTYENPYPRGEEGVSVDNILKAPIVIPADKG